MILTAYDGAILGPIARVLGWIMNWIYVFMTDVCGIENISLTIIIFTIVIYMCLFPITYQQQKFSKLSMKMQPELQKVQKKYQGKKDQVSMQAMQDETQAVYQKYGVSPTGSCVYMLINFPILLALYRVFYNVPAYLGSVKSQFSALVDGIMATSDYQNIMAKFVEEVNLKTVRVDFTSTDHTVLSNYIVDTLYAMNSSGWELLKDKFSGLTDVIVSTQEHISKINNFIGINISDTPLNVIKTSMGNHAYLMVILALLIPVTSYLTQVLNIKLMPQATANGGDNDAMAAQMNTMNKIMPLFSLVFCFTVPVGLGIYWIISALVRTIQQICLNKHFEKIDLDDIIKKNQEKAKKKREKMGISENQINQAAKLKTKNISEPAVSSKEKEEILEKAAVNRSKAKPGSMSAKANLVKEFNEKNSR
ncbi:YidC/Oxa1 family membrane protein insertase [Roseburia sp. BX1005]|uniref:YidC/Oxa1 family membrane protein insertase n=1 Tax=Roseburia zhanii TaxID=2763064 RepID=A0A923LQD4_9FIRM|nr:YidC/Oxa1 family membrane protein insertase [Roseburia zhanii]